ncbi:TetR/AcrR family transcriptional regulator [Neomegalonema sp.]|uniref:TetR/AcrR family transcriptional regulator n=1 Tax=Neomegalonema sp. TaxID=2039713 RepID=UPI002602CBC1|nr:TetR/AcrR family transcriptional regulator [Neomegalonema sp.]MDD2870005.1 helix-turn-helix domain containing protein [Neomegalonema sp.]
MSRSIRPDALLEASRCAARLFVERGVSGTSGEDIAEAAGISKRTLWRYFRNKENCLAPLLALSWKRFAEELRAWPAEASLEDHLAVCFAPERQTPDFARDGLLIAQIVARISEEPDLRAVWLMSYVDGEEELAAIIGDRLGRAHRDFETRLCAASVMAAVRVVDETICRAVLRQGESCGSGEIAAQMSRAIRAASVLPFCDPVRRPEPVRGSPPTA